MSYIVYKITNVANGKIYIGITNKSLQERWRAHCRSALSRRDSVVFHKAILKYGKESFKQEILENNLTESEAQEKEIFYIKHFNSYYLNGLGYNMTYGGEINSHLKGENAYGSRLSNLEALKIIELLKDETLTYSQILIQIGKTPDTTLLRIVSSINKGKHYNFPDIQYPIRKDSRKMKYYSESRQGDGNPACKLSKEKVLEIIHDLQVSKDSQIKIALRYNVSVNTINLINRCKIWTNLHKFKNNIRKESNNVFVNNAKRVNIDEKILSVVSLLEITDLTYKEIAQKTNISVSSVILINSCKIGKHLHAYNKNIRKECK